MRFGASNHPMTPERNGHALQVVVQPADAAGEAEEAVRVLLSHLGEDPARPGLRDTPARVVRALREMTEGSRSDPADVLDRVFDEPYAGAVVVREIPFVSLCEHHLLPFRGTATVAYVPDGRVVGLSKISRLVQGFARRLQMQERLTDDVASALERRLGARGVAVLVRARHACMADRGVRSPAEMVTTAFRGELAEPTARAEFLREASPA